MEKPITEYRFFQAICALPVVQAVWLFGSRARGTAWERSDIDLAVLCPGADDAQWRQVLDIVEEADTLLKIDCVRFDELPADSEFRAAIERRHQVLHVRAA